MSVDSPKYSHELVVSPRGYGLSDSLCDDLWVYLWGQSYYCLLKNLDKQGDEKH